MSTLTTRVPREIVAAPLRRPFGPAVRASLEHEGPQMAKALFGHVGATDPRLVDEVRRLRVRIGELEAELARVRSLNESLVAGVTVEDDLSTLAESVTL
jgi:hypothetical protein